MGDGELTVRFYSPAARVPASHTLQLAVTRHADDGVLVLETENGGKALLELGFPDGTFFFKYSRSRIVSAGHAEGVAFVDAVARWLALVPVEASPPRRKRDPKIGWIAFGVTEVGEERWDVNKLVFSAGGRRAEVFIRFSGDGRRAALVQKDSDYRQRLVEMFEHLLTDGPRRRWRDADDAANSTDAPAPEASSDAHAAKATLAQERAEARAQGKSEALLLILATRGLALSEEQRARIVACTDHAVLDRWIFRSAVVSRADDLFENVRS